MLLWGIRVLAVWLIARCIRIQLKIYAMWASCTGHIYRFQWFKIKIGGREVEGPPSEIRKLDRLQGTIGRSGQAWCRGPGVAGTGGAYPNIFFVYLLTGGFGVNRSGGGLGRRH